MWVGSLRVNLQQFFGKILFWNLERLHSSHPWSFLVALRSIMYTLPELFIVGLTWKSGYLCVKKERYTKVIPQTLCNFWVNDLYGRFHKKCNYVCWLVMLWKIQAFVAKKESTTIHFCTQWGWYPKKSKGGTYSIGGHKAKVY